MLDLVLPQNSIQRRFAMGMGVVLLIAVGLLLWLGDEGATAFWEVWLPVLRGDHEQKTKTIDFALGGTFFASLFSIVLLVGLWFTRRWWCVPFKGGDFPPYGGRVFLTGVFVIVIIAAAVRGPRMSLSLYNDETETMQRYVAGMYEHDFRKADEDLLSDELPRFRAVSWAETMHGNRRGNNHTLFSLVGRAIHEPTVDTPGEVNEFVYRLPALLGGLVSIVAVGGVLVSLGKPRVGLIAMLVLTLHPWHVRFSTEARGYGLQMGFAALAIWCLVRAWRSGGWGWWLGFAVAQAFTLWANVGALYFAIGLNLAAAAGLLLHWQRNRDCGATGVRFRQWFVASTLSAMLFFFVMAPSIPQLSRSTVTNVSLQDGLPFGWQIDVPALLTVGMPWYDADPESPINPAIEKWIGDPLVAFGVVGTLLLIGIGLVSLARQRGAVRWLLVVAPLLGVGLSILISGLRGVTFLEWYVVWATNFSAIWLASGIATLCLTAEGRAPGWRRFAIYGCVLLFLLAGWKPMQVYRTHGKQAMREAVAMANGGEVFPFETPVTKTKPIIAHWYTYAPIYDPYIRVAFRPEHLARLIEKARTENREFYFLLAKREAAVVENPPVIERLDGPEFEQIAVLPGLEEPQFNTEVFRWVGSAAVK